MQPPAGGKAICILVEDIFSRAFLRLAILSLAFTFKTPCSSFGHPAKYPRTCKRPLEKENLPLWQGAGGGGLLAGTRRRPAAGDGVPPSLQIPTHTHILLARSPAPYSPFRRRLHSPTAFSSPMAHPPPSPPRPPPSHIHAGWMVSATRTPTSSAPSHARDYRCT